MLRPSAGDRGGAETGPAAFRLGAHRGHLQPGQSGWRLHGHAPGGIQSIRAGDRCASRHTARAGAARRGSPGAELLAGVARGGRDGQVRAAHRRLHRCGFSQDAFGLLDVLRGRSNRTERRDRGRAHRALVRRGRANVAARRRRSAGICHRHRSAGSRRRTGIAHRTGVDRRRRPRPRPSMRIGAPSKARDCTMSGRASSGWWCSRASSSIITRSSISKLLERSIWSA